MKKSGLQSYELIVIAKKNLRQQSLLQKVWTLMQIGLFSSI